MWIVKKIKEKALMLTMVSAFLCGAVIVQWFWASEMYAEYQRGSGNVSTLGVNNYLKHIEGLKSDLSPESVGRNIGGIYQVKFLERQLESLPPKYDLPQIATLIQTLKTFQLPKYNLTLTKEQGWTDDGRVFTQEDAQKVLRVIEEAQLPKQLLDAQSPMITIGLMAPIGQQTNPSLIVRLSEPFLRLQYAFHDSSK